MANYVLFESAAGYGIFERKEANDVAALLDEVQQSVLDLSRFGKIVKLKAFVPFSSAENALQNINDISEGILNDTLKNFLEFNLPKAKPGKKSAFVLGVTDPKIGNSISEEMGISGDSGKLTQEILRGIRLHFSDFVKNLKESDLSKARLGLGHSYSRCKVKFNVNRVDNMIIQAISLLDQTDKDLNTLSMRVREWYGWHFPELAKIINDNQQFARLAVLIGRKAEIKDELLTELEEIVMDAEKAKQIVDAARTSMGTDLSDVDMINIKHFAERVVSLGQFRNQLRDYLRKKMSDCAPNLAALIGDQVGARLISHAGSLVSLAKAPASTIQILGAEKALFRALKTKGNTPKYGLIFHSPFIGKAGAKNKGRISRYLANKCAIAARIDSFADDPSDAFGLKLKEQVEERLNFYATGEAPRKNVDVMREVITSLKPSQVSKATDSSKKKDKSEKTSKADTKSANVINIDSTPATNKKRSREEEEEVGKSATKSAKKSKSEKKEEKKSKKEKKEKKDK